MKKKKFYKDFLQDSTYAVHFEKYRGLLSKLLNHDPKIFNLNKNTRIVDIGCGYGDILKILRARSYKKIMGIEPDAICRESCLQDDLDVRDGTISRTGLPNNFADVVIVNQVFHHIENYKASIDELARILRSRGFLCFVEPSPTLLRRIMDILTFHTPLPLLFGPVRTRYQVMKLEMETGLYPNFLSNQDKFQKAVYVHFSKLWLRQSWFFQFGKFIKKN